MVSQNTVAGNFTAGQGDDVNDPSKRKNNIVTSDYFKSPKYLRGNQESGFYPPNQPLINFASIDRDELKWQTTTRFANLSPSRAPGDCDVDFNDPGGS